MAVPEELILWNEPINRGRGASHMVQFLHRAGGEQVWVCRRYPNWVTATKYQEIVDADPMARHWVWRRMVRNAAVYAKGRVTHREHATIRLKTWHRTLPNRESEFSIFETMAFID